MRFEKWQGLGNNYIVIRREEWTVPLGPAVAEILCDRNFGIGSDGILEVDLESGTPRMTVWNPDGSTAENCGNGIRMVTRYLVRHGVIEGPASILTGAGLVNVREFPDGRVQVDMGRAVFPNGERHDTLTTSAGDVEFAFVTTGNPHTIIEHADPDSVVGVLGPEIEVDPHFPDRTNVEFIRQDSPSEITMRVWERGVGETLACGTGACASAVAAVRLSGAESPVTVHLAGGDLDIAVADDLGVTMTGPAELIYDGEISDALRQRLENATQ